MSTDPYHAVQAELESTLQVARALQASYRRIRSTARGDSEELRHTREELNETIQALEADLNALNESVQVVEQTGARLFGIDDAELVKRQKYVRDMRRTLSNLKADLSGESQSSSSGTVTPKSPTHSRSKQANTTTGTGSSTGKDAGDADDEDAQAAWSKVEQEMLMQEQDNTLSTISGTLSALARQAGLMGEEIEVHNELLEDLEVNVDKTDSKLGSSMKKLQKFIRDTEETKSGWCILILTIILLILLLAVILV